MTKLAIAGGAGLAALIGVAVLLLAWMAVVAGAGTSSSTCSVALRPGQVPSHLVDIFSSAADRYSLGADGPSVLAALTKIESGFGQNMGPSSAGAIGWTQFLPSTWAHFGVDADGDGTRDPYDPDDAIHSSARYLRASGAPQDWRRALFAYNHSQQYVSQVLELAEEFADPTAVADCGVASGLVGDALRITGGGRLAAVPGFPGQQVDERILADVVHLIRTYDVAVTAGYAPTGHKVHGEHPLGLAVDLVPGPGGSWDDVDRLARWAEPQQNRPRAPFRWVGYDGDSNHGRGHHLHLSWAHAPAEPGGDPAAWVMTLGHGTEPRARPRRQ
jgi:hypothetical protein